MEDELDDRIIYQTYVSHMKLLSRVAWGSLPLNLSPITYCTYAYRMLRAHLFRPEILLCGSLLLLLLMYLHTVDAWTRHLLGKLQRTARSKDPSAHLAFFRSTSDVESTSWQEKTGPISAYAVQGRRPKMEDRFVINERVAGTNMAFFAIFDGHGGDLAANFAKDKMVPSIYRRMAEVQALLDGKPCNDKKDEDEQGKMEKKRKEEDDAPNVAQRRKSFKKTSSTTDECIKGTITDRELLKKLDSLVRPITREVKPGKEGSLEVKAVPISSYIKAGVVDLGKLITDEVLAADRLLVQDAKKSYDVAGTTALMAVLQESRLVVANVGDSRGVMCDSRSNAIPLSFDHKPQQVRERKRIKEAGGFVIFNGVWRVAGILATSRALGDYPLKDKNLVIADPDILTFELADHKPQFLILASDGLWDTFSNEEAVAFIRERLHEPDYGAKSITLQAYYRGSLDNISVIVVNFKEKAFSYQKGAPSS